MFHQRALTKPCACPGHDEHLSRRQLLARAAGGFGAIALTGILDELAVAEGSRSFTDPLAAKIPQLPARAKRVLFLYMSGGVSQVESFDYKPKLFADDGQTISIDNWQGRPGDFKFYLRQPICAFQPGGECGTEISNLFPHIRSVADQLCVIRSMNTNHTNHYESTLGIHTGSFDFARPSMGAWVSYGLGTENENLPSFVVLAPRSPYAGSQTWASDFLPGCHQGTRVEPGTDPIANLKPRTASRTLQELELRLIDGANRRHLQQRPSETALEARIRSFETAFGMQMAAPEVFDLSRETDATLKLYGLQRGQTNGFGWQCLVARRMAERGVRFVELIDGGSSGNWDAHGDMQQHVPRAAAIDQPIAGLILDLKQRGMLDDTLVVWTTEFGRTPYHEDLQAKGREHHHQVFSSWFAGGGVRGGTVYGASDDYGAAVGEDGVHVHDFHATILHLLGLDHERLTFRHAGRDFRLTDVHGHVVHDIIA